MKASIRTPEFWSPFGTFMNYFMSVWGFCVLLAIPCNLIFEAPLPNVEASIFKMLGERKERADQDKNTKKFFSIPRIRNSMRTVF